MTKVFPDRPIEEIPSSDPIFHTLYDLDERFQVPGYYNWMTYHITYEKGQTGKVPHWRCIRDDKGRIMVAICHNMDLGDGWEKSDDPKYEEKWASLAYRDRDELFHLRSDPLILSRDGRKSNANKLCAHSREFAAKTDGCPRPC